MLTRFFSRSPFLIMIACLNSTVFLASFRSSSDFSNLNVPCLSIVISASSSSALSFTCLFGVSNLNSYHLFGCSPLVVSLTMLIE